MCLIFDKTFTTEGNLSIRESALHMRSGTFLSVLTHNKLILEEIAYLVISLSVCIAKDDPTLTLCFIVSFCTNVKSRETQRFYLPNSLQVAKSDTKFIFVLSGPELSFLGD